MKAKTSTRDSSQWSKRMDFTLLTAGRLRWIPEQFRHTKMPSVYEAQSGSAVRNRSSDQNCWILPGELDKTKTLRGTSILFRSYRFADWQEEEHWGCNISPNYKAYKHLKTTYLELKKILLRTLTRSSTVSADIVTWLSRQIKEDFVISLQIGHEWRLSDRRRRPNQRAARQKPHFDCTHLTAGSSTAGKQGSLCSGQWLSLSVSSYQAQHHEVDCSAYKRSDPEITGKGSEIGVTV